MAPRPELPTDHRLGALEGVIFDSSHDVNGTEGLEGRVRSLEKRVLTFICDIDDLKNAVEGLKGDLAQTRHQVAEMMKELPPTAKL